MNLTWISAGTWLLHSAVGGGLVLLVTCLLVSRTGQPARRQRLGEFGLVAGLAVAVLCLAPAWFIVSWQTSPQPTAPSAAPVQALQEFPEFAMAPIDPLVAVDAAPLPPLPDIPAAPRLESNPIDWREALAACLVGVFLLGAGWTMARWVLGWTIVAALVRKARPAPFDIAALFAAMTPGRLRARLLLSGRLRVPVSCGLVRPTVLVPASFCDGDHERRLRWIFAHELTHLERRDAWSVLLFALGQILFFALPWFWWLRRQVRLCQEYVADASAVAALGESPGQAPADYAEFLLTLTGAPAVPLATTGVSGTTSDLYRRVLMLLEEPLRVERRCPRPWAWLTAAGLLALGVLVAGVGVRAEAAPEGAAGTVADESAEQKAEHKIKIVVVPAQTEAREVILRVADVDDKVKPHVIRLEKSADGQHQRWVVVADKDVDFESVRKVLEKLQGEGRLKAEQVEEIRKALEKTGKMRLELRNRARTEATQKRMEALPREVQESLRKLQEQIEKAGGKFDAEALRKQIEKALEKAKAFEKSPLFAPMAKPPQPAPPVPAVPAVPPLDAQWVPRLAQSVPGTTGSIFTGRGSGVVGLGIRGERPSAALADQLNLPKGQGLVITKVIENSPAAKADLRVNDVLLKVGDQAVGREPGALAKIVEGLKPKSTVNAVVLRKGQEVSAKLTVPEPKVSTAEGRTGSVFPGFSQLPFSQGSVVTTMTRTADRFTARQQEGGLSITVTGSVADGKANPANIVVQDGSNTQRFENLAAVPAKYRDTVNRLLQMSGGGTRVESK